ncbi:MAG: YbaB/EbfC family nucleoid-associated protein [Proteobacteria bacterium]|nr:YbaB/EbfC family nucleoid-associated protein [Pseudomonadota bacterium]NBX85821.1 YbaB/EbfC family nucleoid-associated protein [Pseudomonadota bacterium]
MNNMFNMMKKAQEMQKNLQLAQTEIAQATFTGTAASGLVTITINGEHAIQTVDIKPQSVDITDLSLLADLVKIAYNDALQKAQTMAKQKMQAITGGLNIPGL